MPTLDLTCVRCGYQCDQSESLEEPEAVPQPGDITICVNCGQAYRLGANWIPMTDAELEQLPLALRAYLEGFQRARKHVITEDLALKQKFSPQ